MGSNNFDGGRGLRIAIRTTVLAVLLLNRPLFICSMLVHIGINKDTLKLAIV
jgi:hypothetical protein